MSNLIKQNPAVYGGSINSDKSGLSMVNVTVEASDEAEARLKAGDLIDGDCAKIKWLVDQVPGPISIDCVLPL